MEVTGETRSFQPSPYKGQHGSLYQIAKELGFSADELDDVVELLQDDRPETVKKYIDHVLECQTPSTGQFVPDDRQRKILRMLARKCPNALIGESLEVSEKRVEQLLRRIADGYGFSDFRRAPIGRDRSESRPHQVKTYLIQVWPNLNSYSRFNEPALIF